MPSKPKKPPQKPGTKPIDIDPKLVENLAVIGCSSEEIASVIGITERHLRRRLRELKLKDAIEKGRAKGRASLRRMQWRSAEGTDKIPGNVTAQIWLGKQLLGQRSFERGDEPEAQTAAKVTYQWVPRKSKEAESAGGKSNTNPSPVRPDSTTVKPDSKVSPVP